LEQRNSTGFSKLLEQLKRNKNVVYNQVYNSVNFLFSAIFSLLLIKIITSRIAPESYGVYRYVLATVSLCSLSTIVGINKTLGGYVAKGFHGTVKKTTQLSIKTGSIGILILIILGLHSYYNKNNLNEAMFFAVSAVCFVPYTIFNRYRSILAGLEKFRDILIYNILQKIILFLSAVLVIIVLDNGILAYGISQLIITSVILIYLYQASIKNLSNEQIDTGFFRHSLIVSLVGIGTQIITPGIQLYLNSVLGSDMLAYYVIGNKIPRQLAGIIKPVMHPLSISLAKTGKIRYNKSILKFIPLAVVIGLVLYILIYVVITWFGPFVVSDNYSISLYYAKLLGLFIILAPAHSLLYSNVIFEKNNKAVAYSQYITQAVTILGYILLVGKYGIPGIAYTNFIALLIQVIIMIIFIIQDTDIHTFKIIEASNSNQIGSK